MARMLRIEYPGALYHVMARGKRRETVFHDDADRKFFLATLAEVCGMTGWRVHAKRAANVRIIARATAHPIGPSCPEVAGMAVLSRPPRSAW